MNRVFVRSVILVLICLPGLASAKLISPAQIWVFGDSFSDTGNFFASSASPGPPFPQLPPSFPLPYNYDGGRWSNGPMWIEHFASALGAPVPQPGFNLAGTVGTNLAVGGAMTGLGNAITFASGNSGMLAQLQAFLNVYNPLLGAQNPDSLFVVHGGENNIALLAGLDLTTVTQQQLFVLLANQASAAIADLDAVVQGLASVGARTFLMPNMPGFRGEDPDFPFYVPPAVMDLFAVILNDLLDQQIDAWRHDLGVTIYEANWYALFRELASGGILDASQPCLDYDQNFGITGACADPTQFLLFDAVHPTSSVHEAMSRVALAAVDTPQPQTLALFAVACIAVAGFGRRRSRAAARRCC